MIRRCIGLLCMAAAAAGCGRNIPALESGDLLFQAGKGTEMAGAIAAATGAARQIDYTHVGIALCANGADSVLEASTEGVRTVALKVFLAEARSIHGRRPLWRCACATRAGWLPPCFGLATASGSPTTIRSGPTTGGSTAVNWCGRVTTARTGPRYLRPGL